MATRRPPAVPGAHLIREAEAISAGAVAVFLALSFLSFSPDAPRANLGGPVGQALAGTALRALGVAASLFPLYLGYFTVALLRRGAEGLGGLRLVGAGLLVASIAALAGLVTRGGAGGRGGGRVSPPRRRAGGRARARNRRVGDRRVGPSRSLAHGHGARGGGPSPAAP